MKFYNKIDLQSLELDLEKYGSMKKIIEELRINIAKKLKKRDSLKLEVNLLSQEKEKLEKSIDIMQAKIIKVIELLGKAITRAVSCGIGNIGNTTSTIFSANTQVAQLSKMLQVADDNDGGQTTTKKIKKYTADGKIVEE
jgi:hypothetical protein